MLSMLLKPVCFYLSIVSVKFLENAIGNFVKKRKVIGDSPEVIL